MNPKSTTKDRTGWTATCDYCGLPLATDVPIDETHYCCFGCQFAAGISQSQGTTPSPLGPAAAFGLSVFFTINVIMMTMALWTYAGDVQSPFEMALRNFLRYGAMMFSAPVLLLLGRPLFSHAVTALRRSICTTDLLLSTGVIAAFAISVFNTVRDQGHVYYEVGCVILVLVTLGRWLEASGRSHADEALAQLERLVPESVRRWDGRQFIEFPRTQISVGDEIRVIAGERIPLDGRITKGRAIVDEQFFTGESTPIEKESGDSVLGGSLNLDGDLVLTVTSAPNDGALGRLVAAVRQARLLKGRFQLLSDSWSRRFFPIIGGVAILSFLFHGIRVDWEFGLLTALAVLLIACPCALALATPLAVWSALATAAKKGVLFRGGEALESLAAIRAIRWDKTGTLTTGTPRVVKLICENERTRARIETLASNMTDASNHVFSRAINEFLSQTSRSDEIVEVRTIPGRGLLAKNGAAENIRLGSLPWMDAEKIAWGPRLFGIQQEIRGCGPLIAIAYDGLVRGIFLLEETVRPEASPAIQACHKLGLDQGILTGDQGPRSISEAISLPVPVEARLLPEEKLAAIQKAKAAFGRVAMVGDGLNDAPALAAADVGIALGCGADVSRESADVCLLTSDLRLVPWAYQFARRTVRTIQTNLAWSFGYNSVGVILAAAGQLHPAVAAVLMVISSLMVLQNSLQLTNSGLHEFLADPLNSITPSSPPSAARADGPKELAP